MLWLGSPFCPDTRWWASTLERPNRQHCHPHGNKNKKSPLAPSSRIAVVSPSILEPSLHARIAAACSTATVLPPPAFLSPHCHSPLAAEFYKPTRRGPQWLLDCSSVTLFTTPSRLHAAILPPSPLHPSAIYWLPQFPTRLAMAAGGAMCLFQVCYVSSVCCICCNGYMRMLQVYVLSVSVVLYVCFTHFIYMFHVFHWCY